VMAISKWKQRNCVRLFDVIDCRYVADCKWWSNLRSEYCCAIVW